MSDAASNLMRRANLTRRENRLADALRDLSQAVVICRKGDNVLLLAHTTRHVGDMHQDASRLQLAEASYREALALYRGSESTAALDLANTVRPYAILKEGAGDLEETRALWKEAKELYATANVNEGVAESSARLARLER